MLKKTVFLWCMVLSLSVTAQLSEPMFNNKQAEQRLKQAEKVLVQQNVSLQSLSASRDELDLDIEQAQGCIDRQKSNYKKLESTLNIVTMPVVDAGAVTQAADLLYLKDKQQAVRSRLGTCSLYQLKAKDILEQLEQAIITKTKYQTWKKSDLLMSAVEAPMNALQEFSISFKSNSVLLRALSKYIAAVIVGIFLLFCLLRSRHVKLFVEQLQLKPTFLFSALSLALVLGSIDCFFSYEVMLQFETSRSALFFQWTYLGFFYLLTLGYGLWFLSAHQELPLKKIGLPFLFMLIISFAVTFVLALYGYPYLAYYISNGILQTIEVSMIALILIVLSSKLSGNLPSLLSHEALIDDVGLDAEHKQDIEFKVLAVSLKASIVVFWLTVCINIWQLSLSADRVLLKWIYEGFIFLNIHMVPVNLVKAGLIFAIITILVRLIAKMAFKAMNPILLNFSYLIALLCALSVAGVNLTGIAVVAGALSVGIGMGLKGIVNNFISGLILLIEKPIKRGDRIIVNDVEGYVKNIGLRATEIQTPTNTDVMVPNEQLITSTVTNYMLNETSSISSIEVGIAYGANVEKAQELLLKIANDHPHIIANKKTAPWVCLKTFADSAIVLQLIYTVTHAKYIFRTKSELNNKIYQEFNKHHIEFPFPQSDVYIKEFPNQASVNAKTDKE